MCNIPLNHAVSILLLLGLAAGCGPGNQFQVAPVSGKAFCGGEPLTGGTIYLQPLGSIEEKVVGKSAGGEMQPDGSFVLGTYTLTDGAVIGWHRVVFEAPEIGAGAPAACRRAKQIEVEIISGANNLTIDLAEEKLRPTD